MSTPGPGAAAPRRRRRAAASDVLRTLTAARDRLDEGLHERRQREDRALAAYAEAVQDATTAATARETALAELDRRRVAVTDAAEAELRSIAARQGAALVELHGLGRRAEELADLVGLPVKRVRAYLRAHQHRGPVTGEPLPGGPAAAPHGEGTGTRPAPAGADSAATSSTAAHA